LASLLAGEDEALALMALAVLGKINTARSTAAVLPALRDERLDIRYAAAKLAAAGPLPAAACSLGALAAHDPYWKIRLEITLLLTRCNSRAAAETLAALLQDSVAAIRSSAIQNLLGMKREYAGDAVLRSLDNTDEQVRYIAIQAIGNLGDQRAVPRLMQTLKDDPNTYLRQKAAVALAQLGVREAAPLLKTMLAQGSAEEQKAAKEGLEILANFK
jgi:HEAT repeat protein